MPRSRAVIATPHASRYLQQLCKHWSHRFETEFTASASRIALSLGETRLGAGADALTIDVAAEDAAALAELREVVARHVERFAFREGLRCAWQ